MQTVQNIYAGYSENMKILTWHYSPLSLPSYQWSFVLTQSTNCKSWFVGSYVTTRIVRNINMMNDVSVWQTDKRSKQRIFRLALTCDWQTWQKVKWKYIKTGLLKIIDYKIVKGRGTTGCTLFWVRNHKETICFINENKIKVNEGVLTNIVEGCIRWLYN